MRFHKFETRFGEGPRINLDSIVAVTPPALGRDGCMIHAMGYTWEVRESFADVLRLLDASHTPPEPDTYEEELRETTDLQNFREAVRTFRILQRPEPLKITPGGTGAATMQTLRVARLDELARLERAVHREFGTATNWTTEYIERRRNAIEQGED